MLLAIGERLTGAVRRPDVVGRYGGEEFVVILPGAGPEVLLELAERCRRAIADHPFPLREGAPLPITVSLGVAGLPEHAITARELVRTADRALYLAKAAGRNRAQVGADLAMPAMDPALEPMRALPVLERVADLVDLIQASREHSTAVGALLRAGRGRDGAVRGDPAAVPAGRPAARRGQDRGAAGGADQAGPAGRGRVDMMRRHPEHSAWMIGLVPGLGEVSGIVRQHHERLDGTGYPDGCAGTAIRLEARIVSVCDAWAAMLADRAYQPESTPDAGPAGAAGRGRQPVGPGGGGRVPGAGGAGAGSRRCGRWSPATWRCCGSVSARRPYRDWHPGGAGQQAAPPGGPDGAVRGAGWTT